jgi:hypothetical protein
MVHPKVLKAYKDNDFEYQTTAHDDALRDFHYITKKFPKNEIITKIYRVKHGRGEYLFYSHRLEAEDNNGNFRDATEDNVGKYQMPQFRKEYNAATGDAQAVEIVRHETIYEIKFSPKELDKLMKKIDPDNHYFYVISPMNNKPYNIENFDDFRNAKFEELLSLGKSGKGTLEEHYRYVKQQEQEEILKQQQVHRTFHHNDPQSPQSPQSQTTSG